MPWPSPFSDTTPRLGPFAEAAGTTTSSAIRARTTEARRTIRESWLPIVVDDERCLLYGPRLGRFYLVAPERASDRAFLEVIGLKGDAAPALPDPVERIAHTSNDLPAVEALAAPRALAIAYKALHFSRHAVPLRQSARLVRKLAIRKRASGRSSAVPNPPVDVTGLARSIHAVERSVGFSDCYPRALVTAYLCLRAGRGCVLAVGALAPTRKMHAWCSVDGVLPYEPLPEHFLYQPLWTSALAP